MHRSLAVLLAAALLSACVTADKDAERREEKEIVTGSNIPRKDRPKDSVTVMSKEALEEFQRGSQGVFRDPASGPAIRGR